MDEKIRDREKQHVTNDQELKKLVDEYNELIIHKEQTDLAQKPIQHLGSHLTPHEQSFEEALLERIKEYELRLEVLEKRLSDVEKKLDIKPAPLAPATPGAITPATPDAQATAAADKAPTPALEGKGDALSQYNQAMALFNSSNSDDKKKSIEAFEMVINTYPDDPYAHKSYVHAGQAAFSVNDPAKAEKYFEVALTKPLPAVMMVSVRIGLAASMHAQNRTAESCDQLNLLKQQQMTDEQKNAFKKLKDEACPAAKSVSKKTKPTE
jgi:TolA-binding protein